MPKSQQSCSNSWTKSRQKTEFSSLLTQPLTVSKDQLLFAVREKGEKPDRKPYPIPYGLRNPYGNLKPENSQIMPRNLNEIVRSWIRLLGSIPASSDTLGFDGRQM
jgi:hypothetical protein